VAIALIFTLDLTHTAGHHKPVGYLVAGGWGPAKALVVCEGGRAVEKKFWLHPAPRPVAYLDCEPRVVAIWGRVEKALIHSISTSGSKVALSIETP